MRRFHKEIAAFRGRIAFVLFLITISTAFGLVLPAAPKVVIDYILTDNPGPSGLPALPWLPADRTWLLLYLGVVVVGLELASLVVDVSARWQLTKVGQMLAANFQRRVFAHAIHLPLARVFALKSGGVASILRNDAGAINQLLDGALYTPYRAVLRLLGAFVVLVWVDWRLVLGTFLLMPAVYLTHRTWISRIRPIYRGMRKTREAVDGDAAEAFGGMRIVRAFAREQAETNRFGSGIHLMVRQRLMAWWWSRAVEIVWRVMVPMASATVLLYGGMQVLQGSLTIGDVILFTTYTLMLLGPIEQLVSSATTVQSALAGFDRVLDLLEEDTEFAAQEIRTVPENVEGAITMRDVSFSYPGHDKEVLSGINLDVLPGQTIALVGPSGAGKTTLSNLVARFYDPTSGTISLDGTPLCQLDVHAYRSLLGVVEQEVYLFDGTILDNISMARPHASAADVERVARAAHAHDFITELEDAYQTRIGERGVRLSGGQKQRIAIARALLADPRILILDEATSNLDSESEAIIQKTLGELMRGRTSFVIAHRLSTVRHADQILVIDGGRVVERGTHEELVAMQGRYVSFLQHQLAASDSASA